MGQQRSLQHPPPAATASDKTQLSVHFLRSLLFRSWARGGDKTGGWPWPLGWKPEARGLAAWSSLYPEQSDAHCPSPPRTPSRILHLPLALRGAGRRHTYLAGAPPSAFVHLQRGRRHSVNHHPCSPGSPPGEGRGAPLPGGGRIHVERALRHASQRGLPRVEKRGRLRARDMAEGMEASTGVPGRVSTCVVGKTEEDAPRNC